VDILAGKIKIAVAARVQNLIPSLLQAVVSFPLHTSAYAYVIKVLNQSQMYKQFVGKIVTSTVQRLSKALQWSEFDVVRKLVKFIGLLTVAGVTSSTDCVALFTLLTNAVKLESETTRSFKDFLAYTVLSALPWCAETLLLEGQYEDVTALVAIVSKHVNAFPLGPTDTIFNQYQQQQQQQSSIRCKTLLKAYSDHIAEYSSLQDWKGITESLSPISTAHFKQGFVEAKGQTQHALDLRGLKVPAMTKTAFNMPVIVTLFDQQQNDKVVASNLVKTITFDLAHDVILSFQWIRKEGIKRLTALPVDFDFLPTVVETVFSMLLNLPEAPVNLSLYGSLLGDLVRARPETVPPMIGQLMFACLEASPQLKNEVLDRIALFFTQHLSNFQFQWPWMAWTYVAELPVTDARYRFLVHILDLSTRLLYRAKLVKSVLPEELLPLLGPERKLSFNDEVVGEYKAQPAALQRLFLQRQQTTVEDVIAWLARANIASVAARTNLYYRALLKAGESSISAVTVLLEKYAVVSAQLLTEGGAEATTAAVEAVYSSWASTSTLHLTVYLDKFLSAQLITVRAIVDHLFKAENARLLTVASTYEVLLLAVTRRVQLFAASESANTATQQGAMMRYIIDKFVSAIALTADSTTAVRIIGRLEQFCVRFLSVLVPVLENIDTHRVKAGDTHEPTVQRLFSSLTVLN
jgi:nuclear cap-binding protein subunit 1